MDSLSTRLRSQVPEAGEGPSLLELFKLIQSVEKRLTDRLALIENDLKQRLFVAETSLENAHEKLLSLETDLTKFRDEIDSFKEEKRKSGILNELRSKEFNVLFHGLKMSSNTENPWRKWKCCEIVFSKRSEISTIWSRQNAFCKCSSFAKTCRCHAFFN